MIRKLAKDIAGEFHTQASDRWADDPERSARFRDTYPETRDYLRGYQRCAANFRPVMGPDGQPVDKAYFRVKGSDRWWKIDRPGWQFFVEVARLRLVEMLSDNMVSDHEKRAIADALIEENQRATSPHAQSLLQRRIAGKTQVN